MAIATTASKIPRLELGSRVIAPPGQYGSRCPTRRPATKTGRSSPR
jgi:hypothetical protein